MYKLSLLFSSEILRFFTERVKKIFKKPFNVLIDTESLIIGVYAYNILKSSLSIKSTRSLFNNLRIKHLILSWTKSLINKLLTFFDDGW